MRNKLLSTILTLIIGLSPMTGYSQSNSAAGGISAGTAVAIGIVGAALLVALGDSSSGSSAGAAGSTETVASASTTSQSASTTTTTVTSHTTTQ